MEPVIQTDQRGTSWGGVNTVVHWSESGGWGVFILKLQGAQLEGKLGNEMLLTTQELWVSGFPSVIQKYLEMHSQWRWEGAKFRNVLVLLLYLVFKKCFHHKFRKGLDAFFRL